MRANRPPLASRARQALVVLALLPAAACASFSVPIARCPSTTVPAPREGKVVIRYLGVGGFLIRRGNDVLMTAPLYSNPSLLELAANQTIRSDEDLIDRLLPPDASEAKAILVGHSHYDHLMDVPYVALHHAKQATIYGSETTRHLLAAVTKDLGQRLITLDPMIDAWDPLRPSQVGHWQPVGAGIRVAAIRSEHSVQVNVHVPLSSEQIPIHLWRGGQHEDLRALPRTASEWPEGTVYAYVIEFLNEVGHPIFRIYYQDSGTNRPIGYIPDSLRADYPRVDVAILCLGGAFETLKQHPEGIIGNTRPRSVIVAHWEDFFVTQDAYCKGGGHYGPVEATGDPYCKEGAVHGILSPNLLQTAVNGPDTKVFVKRAEKALRKHVLVPCPTRSVFEFAVGPS